ncbi:hypothetical protein ACIP3U_35710 [[Kitasatospora] papulosa]|uniref:hypothetical protein n=1 Tax=[Kitasatospora] papulosa TaxID=1464011 RepID=UPI00380F7ED2
MNSTSDEAGVRAMYAPSEPVQDEEPAAPEEGLELFTGVTRVASGQGHGQFWFPVASAAVNRNSVVLASITQLVSGIPETGFARMLVSNVVPRDGGVVFLLNIDWPTDVVFRIGFRVE